VDSARERMTLIELTSVFRELLREQISIRDLRTVLETVVSVSRTTDADLNKYIVFSPATEGFCHVTEWWRGVESLDYFDYACCVRTALKRYISHKYTRGGKTLVVFLVDPEIERTIRSGVDEPLGSRKQSEILQAVSNELDNLPPTSLVPVILTTGDVRRPLRELIADDFPNVAVLSYQELDPDMNIQPIARIVLE
jgi:type III secretory pathway component EscV